MLTQNTIIMICSALVAGTSTGVLVYCWMELRRLEERHKG